MEIYCLSSKDYDSSSKNDGDCIIIVDNDSAVIFDCGSEEHARRAIEILDEKGIEEALVVLSHNDDDHFKGIPYLIQEGYVDTVFTLLLLKYKDEILDEIGDGRRTRKAIGEQIMAMYDNIASLGKEDVTLADLYEDQQILPSYLSVVGPEKDYVIKAAAKGLDTEKSDQVDSESITNATSIQLCVQMGTPKVLLTGDCPPEAIPEDEDLSDYDYIQLPHHGKAASAKKIFERVGQNNEIIYIVSDNTGNSNGGSDNRTFKGHRCKNTRTDGDIYLSSKQENYRRTGRPLCA